MLCARPQSFDTSVAVRRHESNPSSPRARIQVAVPVASQSLCARPQRCSLRTCGSVQCARPQRCSLHTRRRVSLLRASKAGARHDGSIVPMHSSVIGMGWGSNSTIQRPAGMRLCRSQDIDETVDAKTDMHPATFSSGPSSKLYARCCSNSDEVLTASLVIATAIHRRKSCSRRHESLRRNDSVDS